MVAGLPHRGVAGGVRDEASIEAGDRFVAEFAEEFDRATWLVVLESTTSKTSPAPSGLRAMARENSPLRPRTASRAP